MVVVASDSEEAAIVSIRLVCSVGPRVVVVYLFSVRGLVLTSSEEAFVLLTGLVLLRVGGGLIDVLVSSLVGG